MNRIDNWEGFRARGGRQNRLRLSDDDWQSKILALASEGNLLSQIQGIMTTGHDREMREKWDIGDGTDTKWNKAQRDLAKSTIWEFFKDDIVPMYTGRTAPNGIVGIVKLKTGFVLPESTMLNQLREWGVTIIGRGGGPSVARVTRPSNNHGRSASQIPIPTAQTRARPSSPPRNAPSQSYLDSGSHVPPISNTSSPYSPRLIQPDDAFNSLSSANSTRTGPDTSTSNLEHLIQQVDAYRNELQTYKHQMDERVRKHDQDTKTYKRHLDEQVRKHDRETKTHNENHARVLTMARNHARMADETSSQLATLQRDISQIQEDNIALRSEVSDLRNANQTLRTTISQQENDARQVNRLLNDLRQNFGNMEANHHKLLRDFEALKHENSNLKTQKLEEQRINQMLTQHIRDHARKFQTLFTSPTEFKLDDIKKLVTSLNNPDIQENRRTSRDSAYFSGEKTNSKNLSIGSHSRAHPNKRPRHNNTSPPMGRSVSAQQHENHGFNYTPRRPLTEPKSFDMQSMVDRYEDQSIGSALPTLAQANFDSFLNMSTDNAVVGAQGGYGWIEASPSNAQTFVDSIDGLFQTTTGAYPSSSGPPGNFIFGSSR